MRRFFSIAAPGLLTAIAAFAAPCISATQSCTEWITFNGGPARSLIYRTYSLETRNDAITRAFVMVHGTNRDADNYYRTALAAAFLGNALDNTIVVAPRVASHQGQGCQDTLAPNEVSWNCANWRYGGTAADNEKLTTYDFMDEVLRKLARKEIFPNLRVIVLAGHSAGGMFVTRYEMSNQVNDKLGVPISYIVSNPSSYAYPESVRPMGEGAWSVSARAPGYVPAPSENANASPFGNFGGGRSCTTYDNWPYGFKNRNGYTARFSDDQLKQQLVSRPVTYLLGELDVLPLGGFDGSCPAMAQGPTRLARGEAFSKYVNEKLGAHHAMTIIPLCGHNARCMFTAEPALKLIFPEPGAANRQTAR